MKDRKITKKQAVEFNTKFTKRILELGAKSIESRSDSHKAFKLNTSVGNLEIHLYPDHNFCFSVFSIFDDEKKASLKFACNSYSGKYNWHRGFYVGETIENMVDMSIQHFECTLEQVI